jgi:hypothetical protein
MATPLKFSQARPPIFSQARPPSSPAERWPSEAGLYDGVDHGARAVPSPEREPVPGASGPIPHVGAGWLNPLTATASRR